MFRIAFAVTLVAIASPALATERAHTPHQVSEALKAGCSVQQPHTQSGKIVHQPALVHCKQARTTEAASRDAAPQEKRQSGTN